MLDGVDSMEQEETIQDTRNKILEEPVSFYFLYTGTEQMWFLSCITGLT